MKPICLFLVFCLTSLASRTQDSTVHLSLPEALAAALSQGHAAAASALDVQIAKAQYRQTDAFLLPELGFSYTAAATNDPLNAFAFRLQQKSIALTDLNPGKLNHPSTRENFSGKLELRQPLLNADLLYRRKAAALNVGVQELLLQRTREAVQFETGKAYLVLQLAYEQHKVLQEVLTTSRALYQTSKNYFDQGLIQKSDLLQAGVHVLDAESLVNSSRSAIEDASDQLGILMGRAAGVVYTVDAITISSAGITGEEVSWSERSDFQALQKSMDAYDLMIRSSRMGDLPRLNAFASWQLNNKNLLGYKGHAYLAGIQLTWNIFNGHRTKNTISQQQLEKEKLGRQLDQQKSEAQGQILHARRQLSQALFLMKQQEEAIAQAEEALRVLENRYAQGLVKTTDVLLAHTQLSQQKMGYVQALFQYNLASTSLHFLTAH